MKKHVMPSVLVLAAALSASANEARKLVSVQVFPSEVQLTSLRDRQSMVVQATWSDGITEEVTKASKLDLAKPGLVKLENGTLYPLSDGTTDLVVEHGGSRIVVPVSVQGAQADRPISFRLDVMPVFMKAGCNSGSCHGSARGKDGFRLSLFGFDPEGDHFRLTREMNGRRINLAVPAESLVMEKPHGAVPHSGGTRFQPGSELSASLLRWLEAGAPADAADVATPIALEILPTQAVLESGATHRMTVRAKYSDGTDRDVTSMALFLTNNETSAAISDGGVVTAGERGEAFVMARFATFTVGSQVIVVPKGLQFEFPKVPEFNYVDTLVHGKLKKLRIAPSNLCTDEVFLRRAFIDVVGVMPSREEYERFMADTDPKKREKLVDDLLSRKEFVELWVMKWAELLQMRSNNQVSYKSVLRYYDWLKERVAANVPMNVIVRDLLASSGGTFKEPATNYYQLERDTLRTSENVAQVFMGMRIQCAQCHNHPFDRWTMDDYYSFAAFFSQIGRKGSVDPREIVVFNSGSGDVRHLVGGRVMAPKYLGGSVADVQGKDRRRALADWLASPENPYFARNLANIVWTHFFGVGIIEPVDDVRVSNPASNPELLDELARKFTEYQYDFKRLVRDICTSRAYQLSTQTTPTNEKDDKNFSHARIRRLRAEVLLDCVAQATEAKNKFSGLPLGARAVQIVDGGVSTYFLTTFGRATRDTVCSCEVKMDPNLSQAFHLLNGDTVAQSIARGGVIQNAIKDKQPPQAVIEDLYIRCFARKPTDKERAALQKFLNEEPDQVKVLEDAFWAMLNSKEFYFSH